jgi:phospholipid/cholesterol/gamma-HCH transport system substrate-binding protein
MNDTNLSARSRTLFALLGAGTIAAAAAGVVVKATPSHAGSTTVTASFTRAGQGLDPGKSDVKVRGITVGTVASVRLQRDGRVAVRLRIDKGVRVARTATAAIEPVSVFGPKDVDLDLGAGELTGPYLADGDRITRTRDPQEISDTAWPAYRLTRAIDPDEVATLLHTFGAGLDGRGPTLNRTLGNLSTVVDGTYANKDVLRSLIDDLTGLSGTLADHGPSLVGAVNGANRLAPVVYDRPDNVARLLDEAGRVAGTVGTTLDGHGRNLARVLDATAGVAGTLNARRNNIPMLIEGLNGFFDLLGKIIRLPGPNGTMVGQVSNTLPLDLCQVLVDVCPKEASR